MFDWLGMVKEKCEICKEDLKIGFMDKVVGTPVRTKNKVVYVCSLCQKEYKDDMKKKLEEWFLFLKPPARFKQPAICIC